MPKHKIVPIVKMADAIWSTEININGQQVMEMEKKYNYRQLQKLAQHLGIDYHVSKNSLAMSILAKKNIFFSHETGYVNRTLVHMVRQLVSFQENVNLPNNKLRLLLVQTFQHALNTRMGSDLVKLSKAYDNILFTESAWCSNDVRNLINAEQQDGTSLQSYIRFILSRSLQLFEAWKVEKNPIRKEILSNEWEQRRNQIEDAIDQYTNIIKSFCSNGCTHIPEEMKEWAKKPRFKTTLIVCNVLKHGSKMVTFKRKDKFGNGFVIDKVFIKEQVVWLGLGKQFLFGAYWSSSEEEKEEENEEENEEETQNNLPDHPPNEPQIIQMPPGFIITAESSLPVLHRIAQPQSIGLATNLAQFNALQFYEGQPIGEPLAFQSNIIQVIPEQHEKEKDPLLNDLKSTALSLVKEGLQFSANQLLQFVMHVAYLHTQRSFMGEPLVWTTPSEANVEPNIQVTLMSTKPLRNNQSPHISNALQPVDSVRTIQEPNIDLTHFNAQRHEAEIQQGFDNAMHTSYHKPITMGNALQPVGQVRTIHEARDRFAIRRNNKPLTSQELKDLEYLQDYQAAIMHHDLSSTILENVLNMKLAAESLFTQFDKDYQALTSKQLSLMPLVLQGPDDNKNNLSKFYL